MSTPSNLNNQFTFQYDFGDNWKISLNVESIETKEIMLHDIPRVTEGSVYGLIEDIGGNSGLHDYIEAIGSGELDHYYQIRTPSYVLLNHSWASWMKTLADPSSRFIDVLTISACWLNSFN